MRQLNPAEMFYLSVNTNLDVNTLANALMTTEEHVRLLLSQTPVVPLVANKKKGRPKKQAPTPQTVMPPIETVKKEPLALETMARNKTYGAIAMTQASSEHCDAISQAAPKKLPEGVHRFHE